MIQFFAVLINAVEQTSFHDQHDVFVTCDQIFYWKVRVTISSVDPANDANNLIKVKMLLSEIIQFTHLYELFGSHRGNNFW